MKISKSTDRKTAALLGILLLAGCNSPPQAVKEAPEETTTNDFPTLARVEYVLQCMKKHGGQSYDTLYPCACSLDKIASKIPYEEYAQAQTFSYLRGTPGEAGGLFRDPPQAEELSGRLEQAEEEAEKACFVKGK